METYENSLPYKGYKIDIYRDNNPESPREWSNVAHFALTADFGDEKAYDAVDALLDRYVEEEKGDELRFDGSMPEKLAAIRESGEVAMQPIYMYEHGGATIWSGGGPTDKWDSGCIGFAYITKDDLRESQIAFDESDPKDFERVAFEHIEGETKTLDDYIRGDVFGFEVRDEDDNVVETIGGYYGYDAIAGMKEEARAIVDREVGANMLKDWRRDEPKYWSSIDTVPAYKAEELAAVMEAVNKELGLPTVKSSGTRVNDGSWPIEVDGHQIDVFWGQNELLEEPEVRLDIDGDVTSMSVHLDEKGKPSMVLFEPEGHGVDWSKALTDVKDLRDALWQLEEIGEVSLNEDDMREVGVAESMVDEEEQRAEVRSYGRGR